MDRATAYDLTQFVQEENNRRNLRVVKTNKKKRTRQRFKMRLIASVVVILVLMAATVYSKLQLAQVKKANLEANQQLTEITSENVYLSYELESSVSLLEAAEYAEQQLGLVRRDSSQIEYVNLREGNKLETESDDSGGFFAFIRRIIDFLFGGARP